MNKYRMEMLVNNEILTPLELFKKVKRREESSEHIKILKKMMACAIKEELSPRQRQCILLYYVHGYSQREIAQRLRINPSVVSRHVTRGLKRLQRALKYGCFSV